MGLGSANAWPLGDPFSSVLKNDGTVEAGWDGYQPQTPWYPCLISGGGGAYGFIMTFRFGPYFFPPFGGPVVLGGGADQLVVIVGLMARCFGILRVRNNEPLADVKRSC